MRKQQLLELLRAIECATGEKPLIVVGSQSTHGQIGFAPDATIRSHEVDIFILRDSPNHDIVDYQFGPNSAWYAKAGVYADTVGPGIVTLPPGWRERLVSVADDSGAVSHLALELHDVSVTKLIAGRDKDYSFLAELIEAAAIDIGTLMDRTSLMRATPFAGALHSRLTKLAALMRERRWQHLVPPIEQLLASL